MRRVLCIVGVFCLGLVTGGLVSCSRGIARPMTSDAFYYLSIARSLACGEGYVLKDGFWPDRPTTSRSPGWPFTISLLLRVVRPSNPDLAMRILGVILHAMGAALVCGLTFRVFAKRRDGVMSLGCDRRAGVVSEESPAAECRSYSVHRVCAFGDLLPGFLAGAIMALHPVGLYLADEGGSEPLFIVLMLSGVLLILGHGWRKPVGSVLLGIAALVRPYFLLFAILWPVGLLFAGEFSRSQGWICRVKKIMATGLCAALVLLPSVLWAWRNYLVAGEFPVLSSLQGQTFYGGNNALTALPGKYWGYWVFPDAIPGETSMKNLAVDLNEVQVNDYYMKRGAEFLIENPLLWPSIVVGKLVRAYIPVPWSWSSATAIVSVFRFLFYFIAGLGLKNSWRGLKSDHRVVLVAMGLSNVLSVVIFWGCARFAYTLDPFLAMFGGSTLALTPSFMTRMGEHFQKSPETAGLG